MGIEPNVHRGLNDSWRLSFVCACSLPCCTLACDFQIDLFVLTCAHRQSRINELVNTTVHINDLALRTTTLVAWFDKSYPAGNHPDLCPVHAACPASLHTHVHVPALTHGDVVSQGCPVAGQVDVVFARIAFQNLWSCW